MLETREDIKAYLDDCIRFWRQMRDDPKETKFPPEECIFVIDTFQSVRVSIFDELLE